MKNKGGAYYYKNKRDTKLIRHLKHRIAASSSKVVIDEFNVKFKVFDNFWTVIANYQINHNSDTEWLNDVLDDSNKKINDIKKECAIRIEPLLVQIATIKQEIKKYENEGNAKITEIIDNYKKLEDDNTKKIQELVEDINTNFQNDEVRFLQEFCNQHQIAVITKAALKK
jgi:hypothetical protein